MFTTKLYCCLINLNCIACSNSTSRFLKNFVPKIKLCVIESFDEYWILQL